MALLRPFRHIALASHIMGNYGALGLLWFKLGGALPNLYLGNFNGFLPPYHGQPPWPLPLLVALLRPFQGNPLVFHVMGDSGSTRFVMTQTGGASSNQLFPGQF
jgi:hypothetical protein